MYIPETGAVVEFEIVELHHPRPVPEPPMDDYAQAVHVLHDWQHMFPDRAFTISMTVH